MNWKSYLWPQKVYSSSSVYSKHIEVMESFGKKYLRVNKLTQSGGVVESIYQKAVPVLKKYSSGFGRVLILGFGAGTFANLLNRNFLVQNIIGVEIDPEIIRIAKKYFGIDRIKNLELKYTKAMDFIKKEKESFDLIFLDTYLGEEEADELNSESILLNIKNKLNNGGILLINRLNFRRKLNTNNYLGVLHKMFKSVETVRAFSNLLFVCYK